MMWSVVVVLGCCITPNILAAHAEADLPSFLFLLGDDIGWADVSYNNGTAKTPHLDAWAASAGSLKMQDFHSGGTVCSPTRASVLTGRTPWRDCVAGVYGCSDPTECTPNFPFAPRNTFTVPDAVRSAHPSYKSYFSGKWHLGSFYKDSPVPSSPLTHGFDHMNATIEVAPTATTNCMCKPEWQKGCLFGHDHKPTHCNGGGPTHGCCFNYWWEDPSSPHGVTNLTNPTPPDDSAYLAQAFELFLEKRAGAPFMAQVSFHNCHIPYIGTNASRKACQEGKTCKPGTYTDAQLDFYACLTELDASVGRVLAALEKYGYAHNTLTWFTTDNGPEGDCGPEGYCTPDHFQSWPGSAGPLRGRKRDIWEGGHRVPGIISWPAVIKANREVWTPVITSDFLPTVMEILGVERPAHQRSWGMDGTSLLPLLKGDDMPDRGLGWMFSGWTPDKNQHGFRYGRWKFVDRSKSCSHPDCEQPLLFDLHTDLGEKTDVSKKHPDILKAITANFTNWYESVRRSIYNESRCPNAPTTEGNEVVFVDLFV